MGLARPVTLPIPNDPMIRKDFVRAALCSHDTGAMNMPTLTICGS
jgi:hypothetical protein